VQPAALYPALAGLQAAWCPSVPFDKAQKMIHLRGDHPGPLTAQ
jgi:hypothetical protein